MDYFKPFSADTQAAFFSAEAEMIRFGERAAQLPHAEYLKNTLLAIDAVFAIRMAHDIALPPVPLIVLFDVAGWKFDNDVERCLASMRSMLRLPEETSGSVIEALHYMQALEWVSSIAKPGFEATLETVVRLNENPALRRQLRRARPRLQEDLPAVQERLGAAWRSSRDEEAVRVLQRRVLLPLGPGVG